MQTLNGREYSIFADLLQKAKTKGRIRVSVAQPTDETSLSGVVDSYRAGLIDPILVGDQPKILATSKEFGLDISDFEIIHAPSDKESAMKAVEFATNGEVGAIMKGNLHTNDIMGAVVRREANLRTEQSITHAFVLDIPAYHKALLIADAAINIAPDLKVKMSIIKNTVDFAHKLGIKVPKVALLSAVEVPYEKIPSSMEAHELTQMAKHEVQEALVYGPLALDNAISSLSAKIKKIDSAVCGDPDILVAPQIESGNILFKALVYLAYAQVAGIVLGAKVPVILTSRADNAQARVASCALAVLASQK